MQVAHQNDHITHAVIGGGETIDFGISSSAEFFNILSSTLYSDQKLAVARETLCNAWDAHIEAGTVHVPVDVTLTEDCFIIKDYGTGIHRDDMGMIYGTYGNSTKKNDGQQTGGFGLGCKSPFAYTDHFEVTSCHDGVKTIYNLSKSSAAAQGKPGIVPIVSFPTEETGLQVKIGIHNRGDFHKFHELVKRIARNGDMHVRLNGKIIEPLGFDVSKSNYLITPNTDIMGANHRVMVRYGNVVYPVDSNDVLHQTYHKLLAHLNRLSRSKLHNIIFQAAPHSISVTPSRESLSMQEHTVKTLLHLFTGFLKEVQEHFETECMVHAERIIKGAVVACDMAKLLQRTPVLPIEYPVSQNLHTALRTVSEMAKLYITMTYPEGVTFRKQDITWRLQGLSDAGLLDRGLVQTFLRELGQTTTVHKNGYPNPDPDTQWLQRRVLRPLLVKMQKGGIDHSKLCVYDPSDLNAPDMWAYKNKEPTVTATSVKPLNIFNTLPYLRNIIVLSTSGKDIKNRIRGYEVFKELGNEGGFLFYKLSMAKKEQAKELAFFKASGMNVVDTTVNYVAPSRSTAPRKAKVVGLPALSAIHSSARGGIDTRLLTSTNVPRITNPKFIVQVSLASDSSKIQLPHFGIEESQLILDVFGAEGAIVNNGAMYAKALREGAMDMWDYVRKEVYTHIETSPAILEYWAFNPDRLAHISPHATAMLGLLYSNDMLRKKHKLVNNLTERDKKMLKLWNYFATVRREDNSKQRLQVKATLDAIPLHPANKALTDKLTDSNPLLKALNYEGMGRVLNTKTLSTPEINKLVKILAIILE